MTFVYNCFSDLRNRMKRNCFTFPKILHDSEIKKGILYYLIQNGNEVKITTVQPFFTKYNVTATQRV